MARESDRSVSILVVEDDAAMRDLLTEELGDAGYTVQAASGASIGLELARAGKFDLIITDLRMPEMDGFDLIRGVCALPEAPHVVMITAFGSIETAIRAVKLGAYDYITKPFEIEELLLVADKALGERALRTQVARLQREVEEKFGLGNIIAKSQSMRDVVSLVQRIAGSTRERARHRRERHRQGADRARASTTTRPGRPARSSASTSRRYPRV